MSTQWILIDKYHKREVITCQSNHSTFLNPIPYVCLPILIPFCSYISPHLYLYPHRYTYKKTGYQNEGQQNCRSLPGGHPLFFSHEYTYKFPQYTPTPFIFLEILWNAISFLSLSVYFHLPQLGRKIGRSIGFLETDSCRAIKQTDILV